MPYELYKFLHVSLIFLWIIAITAGFLMAQPPKWSKIVGGICTLLVFVAGMGLIARIGIPHGESWPLWIKAKVTIWLVSAIAVPVLSKRAKSPKMVWLFYGLFILAVYFAVYKIGE